MKRLAWIVPFGMIVMLAGSAPAKQAPAGDNLLANGADGWNVAGRKTSLQYDKDAGMITVSDQGRQMGPNSPYVPLEPGAKYTRSRANSRRRASPACPRPARRR